MARAVAALVVAGFVAVASACGSSSRTTKPAINILHWHVLGSSVVLQVKINGWKMAAPRQGVVPQPRTGQWQIFAGDRYVGFSDEPSYGVIEQMPVGTYRVWVALARTDYSLVYPLIRSRSVTVRVSSGGV
jgi:hypothetical protein